MGELSLVKRGGSGSTKVLIAEQAFTDARGNLMTADVPIGYDALLLEWDAGTIRNTVAQSAKSVIVLFGNSSNSNYNNFISLSTGEYDTAPVAYPSGKILFSAVGNRYMAGDSGYYGSQGSYLRCASNVTIASTSQSGIGVSGHIKLYGINF